MCGIVGYVGDRPAQDVLISGLKRLEYRGYDSAGIATLDDNSEPHLARSVGKIVELEKVLSVKPHDGKLGIGKNEVKIDNVVGLIYDQRAVGLCPYKTKVTASYTASADFTTYWKHLLLNYIVNSSFNMVALIMD